MPKKVTPPLPLERWFRDLHKVEELRNILTNESFQTAVAILKEIAGPTFASLQNPETNSQRLAWYAGYRDAFNDLEKLTKSPEHNTGKTSSLDEWTHIK